MPYPIIFEVQSKKMAHLHPLVHILKRSISLSALAIFVCLFSACSPPPAPKVDTFGELDSARIAADTSMQSNMDLSYEYQKSLVLSDSVVFDFLAYDRPSLDDKTKWEGKFIVIERTSTSQDTVIRGARFGPVRGLNLTDLDGDGRPEILFYENQTAQKYKWLVRIFSPKPDGSYREIRWTELDAKPSPDHYRGGDTFFVYQNYLIRRFPYFEKDVEESTKANLWQSYKLNNGKLILENEKLVQ